MTLSAISNGDFRKEREKTVILEKGERKERKERERREKGERNVRKERKERKETKNKINSLFVSRRWGGRPN